MQLEGAHDLAVGVTSNTSIGCVSDMDRLKKATICRKLCNPQQSLDIYQNIRDWAKN
jgi:hypothetical protein